MNYKCKNCGGSMIYAPELKKMYCPYCDGEDCYDIAGDRSITVCPWCGGELNVGAFDSASKCPFCDNYIIYDVRVEGEYKPDKLIPFVKSKKEAIECIEKEFGKRVFIPAAFLSEKRLKEMMGRYVPFFLYDYNVKSDFSGIGTKVKTWRTGDYVYTETSTFDVERKLRATYLDIPADASTEMPDTTMDLIEPYMYDEIIQFDPKFLSGFYGEIYNKPSGEYEFRARKKAFDSTKAIMTQSLNEYIGSLKPAFKDSDIILTGEEVEYALFPVWVYRFKWGGKEYPIYVNGQTGKVVGRTPVSKLKVVIYGLFGSSLAWLIAEMLIRIWEVL